MPEKLIYENPLSNKECIRDFRLEGSADISFEQGAMMMQNALDAEMGQKANYVLWCPQVFPADVRIEWEFRPLTEHGLCILFFAAKGKGGYELFDRRVPRFGEYVQYHHGNMDAFHLSYFRRKEADERALHTCNLRKSYGFHLVAQGGDPLPDAKDMFDFYRLCVAKKGEEITFSVNDVQVFQYVDDGVRYGPLLGEGCIGFRQLAPLKALYRNLRVYVP